MHSLKWRFVLCSRLETVGQLLERDRGDLFDVTKPMQETIQIEITSFLVEQLLNHQVSLQLESTDDLLGGGLVDSLGIMRLIAFIEEEHGIRIPPGDVTIENFRSIETVARYVEERVAQ